MELSPIFYSKVNEAGEDLGYIKLTNFSNNAATDMQKAIVNLSDQGVQGFILDLRGNPGGLVNAGLDIARWVLLEDSTYLTDIQNLLGSCSQFLNLKFKLAVPLNLTDFTSIFQGILLKGTLIILCSAFKPGVSWMHKS